MVITNVKIKLLENSGTKLKAAVSITLDNMVAIHDIKIIEKESGPFIAMPRTSKPNGFQDIVHPINPETRDAFVNIILSVYQTAIKTKTTFFEAVMDTEEGDTVLTQDCNTFNPVGQTEKPIYSSPKSYISHNKPVKKQVLNKQLSYTFINWLKTK